MRLAAMQGDVETRLDELSDDALARRAAGDPEAFAGLYERYYEQILNYTFRCTMNVGVAEELTGRTFLKALEGIGRYRPAGSFRAWLFRIAVNEVRMYVRSRRRRPEAGLSDAELERITFGERPDELAEEKEQKLLAFARVHRALMRLPAKYQAVITLRFFQEMTNDEIAAALGKRPGTIKSLISRGLAKLRDAINGATGRDEP